MHGDAPLIPIPNARQPLPGVLTGGQPTEEQLLAAARQGYRTFVNLKGKREQHVERDAGVVADLGLTWVHIPVGDVRDLSAENARELLDAIDRPGARPAMVYCGSGNRVGALFAMAAYHHEGKSVDQAIAFGESAGMTRLSEPVRAALERA